MTQSISLPTPNTDLFADLTGDNSLPVRTQRRPWVRLLQRPTTQMGLIIVLTYLLLALFGDWIAPYPYTEQHLSDTLQSSSSHYLLGTDQFGRDILSRVIVGSRSIILLATTSTLLALLLGGAMGIVAAYYGGLLDEVLMRLTDIFLSFPVLLLALLILSTLGSAMIYLIACIGVIFAPAIARVVRSVVLELKTREFVEAARMIGARDGRIMAREILPNLLNTLLVEAAIYFGYAILVGSGLGFLGMGVQPPSPDWGLQVSDGRNFLLTAPWVVIYPALAISTLVIGINLLTDGLTEGKR